jgi:hypothetical protein
MQRPGWKDNIEMDLKKIVGRFIPESFDSGSGTSD